MRILWIVIYPVRDSTIHRLSDWWGQVVSVWLDFSFRNVSFFGKNFQSQSFKEECSYKNRISMMIGVLPPCTKREWFGNNRRFQDIYIIILPIQFLGTQLLQIGYYMQIIRKSKEREKKNTCNEVKSKKFFLVVCRSVVNLSFSLLSLSIVFFRFALKVFM